LFKGQFIGCKGKGQEKSWWSFQERLGWLTGLIDKILLYNMGHSAWCTYANLIVCILIECMSCDNIHKVLSRGLHLRGQIDRFLFCGRACIIPAYTHPCLCWEFTTAILTIKWPLQGMSKDNSGWGQRRIQHGVTFCWRGSSLMVAFFFPHY
jgi:hypothetical protein